MITFTVGGEKHVLPIDSSKTLRVGSVSPSVALEVEEMTDTYLPEGSWVSIRQPKNVQWAPQEDITAYELALCLPVIMSLGVWYREDYIPKGCERHFKVTDR